MANLFEKPIAANPMSTFAELPLAFIDQAIQRKQAVHDKAKAELDAQEDSLLKLQYLSGDSARHHEIQKQYEEKLNSIVEGADNDYANILPQIDRFARDLRYEINYGELGAQQKAFSSAMKMKELEDKKLAEGKSSEEGYNMFLSSLGKHKTQRLDDGNFTPFQGYSSSTIVDPIKVLRDSADEITSKYDAEGMKYVSPELIAQNIMNTVSGNSNVVKALQERIYGKTDSTGKPITLDQYLPSVIKGVVADKGYYEVAKLTEAEKTRKKNGGSDFQGMVMQDVGQPKTVQGELKYSGGSSPLLKDFTALFGADSWKEHNDIINKESTKRRIKYMEAKTGTKFPNDPREQRNWLMDNLSKDQRGEISTRGADEKETNAITDKGQLRNPNAAVYDRAGNKLDSDEIQEIQGTSKDAAGSIKKSFISNVVTSGAMHPPGTYVMTSHNGEQYFIEPSDPTTINSPQYNNALIDMASKTNTGVKTVTLRSNVDEIPMGTYEVEHVGGSNYNLYQGGKLVYRKFVSGGDVYGVPVNKEE